MFPWLQTDMPRYRSDTAISKTHAGLLDLNVGNPDSNIGLHFTIPVYSAKNGKMMTF